MKNSQKILFDVDTGGDDAIAIMMALKFPNIDVLGITTTFGNTNVKQTTINTLRVLNYFSAKIPVVMGATKPLVGKSLNGKIVHGKDGLGDSNLPLSTVKPFSKDATEFLFEVIKRNPNSVTIVALGPLTNIAKLLLKKPMIEQKIKRIVIMGGTITEPGVNPTQSAEFNLYNDPLAAQIILKSKIQKILVPLDLTNKIFLTNKHLTRFNKTNTKEGTFLYKISTYWRNNFLKEDKFILWDPVAFGYVLKPKLYTIQKKTITIETNNKEKLGKIRIAASKRSTTFLATDIRKKEFISFFKTLIK